MLLFWSCGVNNTHSLVNQNKSVNLYGDRPGNNAFKQYVVLTVCNLLYRWSNSLVDFMKPSSLFLIVFVLVPLIISWNCSEKCCIKTTVCLSAHGSVRVRFRHWYYRHCTEKCHIGLHRKPLPYFSENSFTIPYSYRPVSERAILKKYI